MKSSKVIEKYLEQYAETEVEHMDLPKYCRFQHAIVIPAFNESEAFVERFLTSTHAKQACLLIVVINQPDNDLGKSYAAKQIKLQQAIKAFGQCQWQHQHLSLITPNSHYQTHQQCHILLVDKFTQPIASGQGVGLARKIGADIAIKLFYQGKLNSSFIHSTDADATLPDNYLTAHQRLNNYKQTENKSVTKNDVVKSDAVKSSCAQDIVASCCNFSHVSDDQALYQANYLYEQALRYYVQGLTFAQSPYAYFTIGSVLSFNILAYCQVRGFPKRSAGEDFYLLNKLAKIGDIAYFEDVVVCLAARPSDRVPFGTGPAVRDILTLTAQGEQYYYYHPQVFIELKHCLASFKHLWQQRSQLDSWLANLSPPSQQALNNIGFCRFVEKQKQANNKQFNKQLHVWFDSFKTLKFIHQLRDLEYPNIPLQQALTQAEFTIEMVNNS